MPCTQFNHQETIMRTIHDSRYRCIINRLVAVRRERGLTQVQVARRLGWQRTMLSNVETRQRRLDLLELHELCRIYGLRLADMEALLSRKGE